MDRNYLLLNMKYFKQAFLFLAFGTLIFILGGVGLIPVALDSAYLIWLFGFVVSMVFGITNIMIPSYAKSPEFSTGMIRTEIICLDAGLILLFAALNLKLPVPIFALASSLLFLSVLIHIYDIMFAAGRSADSRMESGVGSQHVR